jgi:hypothetical protein
MFRVGALILIASLIAATVFPANWAALVLVGIGGAWVAFAGAVVATPKEQGAWLEIEDV